MGMLSLNPFVQGVNASNLRLQTWSGGPTCQLNGLEPQPSILHCLWLQPPFQFQRYAKSKTFQDEQLRAAADTKVALVQRSCGYADRPTLAIAEIQRAIDIIKQVSPACLVLVDNCYGEFTEPLEPCAVHSTQLPPPHHPPPPFPPP